MLKDGWLWFEMSFLCIQLQVENTDEARKLEPRVWFQVNEPVGNSVLLFGWLSDFLFQFFFYGLSYAATACCWEKPVSSAFVLCCTHFEKHEIWRKHYHLLPFHHVQTVRWNGFHTIRTWCMRTICRDSGQKHLLQFSCNIKCCTYSADKTCEINNPYLYPVQT